MIYIILRYKIIYNIVYRINLTITLLFHHSKCIHLSSPAVVSEWNPLWLHLLRVLVTPLR